MPLFRQAKYNAEVAQDRDSDASEESLTPASDDQPNSLAIPEPIKRSKLKSKNVLDRLRSRLSKLNLERKRGGNGGQAHVSEVLEVPSSSTGGRASLDSSRDSTYGSLGKSASQESHGSAAVADSPAAELSVSILTTDAIVTNFTTQQEEAKKIRQLNSFFRKVVWVDGDRDLLCKAIDDLRTGNADLEWLLEHRPRKDPKKMLPFTRNPDAPTVKNASLIQEVIQRLHEALASANTAKAPEGLVIDVQLTEDPWDTTSDAAQQDYLPFRPSTYVFVLRVLLPGELSATQILAETTCVPNATPVVPDVLNVRIADLHLDVGAAVTAGNAGPEDYEPLGYVCRATSAADTHHLFYDTQDKWVTTKSLEDIIPSKEFRQQLSPVHRGQLARLFAISSLYLSLVRNTCAIINPSAVRYYHQAFKKDHTWSLDAPFVLTAYLRVGFGSRPPKLVLGERSISRRKINPIVELGVMLFQIGACRALQYSADPVGVPHARVEAVKCIHEVDASAGPAFTEMVQACLACEDSSEASDENEFLQTVVAGLRAIQKRLEELPTNVF